MLEVGMRKACSRNGFAPHGRASWKICYTRDVAVRFYAWNRQKNGHDT